MKRIILFVAAVLTGTTLTGAIAGEIGFIEDFALAKDRTLALEQLIPGTEDFYYYHCLHYQNSEQYDRVDQLLQVWIKRYNYTPRVREIQHRQALLTYPLRPNDTLGYLRNTLNLRFDHQREMPDARPQLPTRLDESLIGRDRLAAEAYRKYSNLDGFEDVALQWLLESNVPEVRRRALLSRLVRPDHPQLVKFVLDDLNYKDSGGFGSLPIHAQLLLAQLDECLTLKPDLLNNSAFINTYLSKLRPSDDVDWQHDMEARRDYLQRLWTFVERLAPTHNSLKANVLYHRLVLDRELGQYDKKRFTTYIQLPRAASYVNPRYLNQPSQQRFTADLNASFDAAIVLPAVSNDEPLVRSYLQHFFLTETTYQPFEAYLNDVYLKHLFAETKIVNGLGDSEQWSALLPPEQYQALKQRVDIDFAFTNKSIFRVDQPIRLDLHVKNVATLIVNVFEINTGNYYRRQLREVNTDINLDGLVPNQELTFQYDEPALRRTVRHFEFPELTQPGVYVIDFIGNGKSSRAVIRKGRLHHLVRTSTAGQIFTVLDEQNQIVTDARLWLAGHQYEADEDGTITVPFSTNPASQPIVLSSGSFASLDHFVHQDEQYALTAGIFVDRESLLKRKKAQLVLRPQLTLNGTPVTLTVLKDPRLVLTSTDHDGVSTNKEVADFGLFEDRESIYEFQVPQRLSRLSVRLEAKVRNQSQNKEIDLTSSELFVLNQIDPTDKFEDAHLLCHGGQYVVDILGKTGEARAHRPVRVKLKHRDFRDVVDVVLQSDEAGRIHLGPLAEITNVSVTGPQGADRSWPVHPERHSHYTTVHGREGTPIELPFMGSGDTLDRSQLSLLELRQSNFIADRFSSLKLDDGMLVISDLIAGDYDLTYKTTGETVRIVITAGRTQDNYVLGDYRQLEIRDAAPLQIARVVENEDTIDVHLRNASKFARVHVFATRYEPAFWAFDYLGRIRDCEPYAVTRPKQISLYVAGRNIGDEYRYIIDRKYAKKYPGNMLARPSLLLTPWALRQTESDEEQLQEGEAFDPMADARAGGAARMQGEARQQAQAGDFANLDFLDQGSAVLLNLTPDNDGLVAITREQLGPHQRIWVVAVDPDDTACRQLSLEEPEAAYRDLRLAENLDPEKHFTQQKSISILKKDQKFELSDISSASFETYDSLTKVHTLLVTLSNNETLAEFSFVLNWDQLTPEQKREKYSKYACHELSFFVARKDPEFFRQVVLPFLKNKKDKTFLDRWLIGDPLADYLDIWNYQQLNVAERILLAQRVQEESTHTARWVRDQFDLLPPDTERFDYLFGTAVKGSALDTDDQLGLEEAKKSLQPGRGGRVGVDSKGLARRSAGQAGMSAATAEAAPRRPRKPQTNWPEKPTRRSVLGRIAMAWPTNRRPKNSSTAPKTANQKGDCTSKWTRPRNGRKTTITSCQSSNRMPT